MNNTNSLSEKLRALQENNDGTLKGGYLSLSGGRYRIIINANNDDPNGNNPNYLPTVWDNMSCGGSTNMACKNFDCDNSTNSHGWSFADCINGYCIGVHPSNPSNSSNSSTY